VPICTVPPSGTRRSSEWQGNRPGSKREFGTCHSPLATRHFWRLVLRHPCGGGNEFPAEPCRRGGGVGSLLSSVASVVHSVSFSTRTANAGSQPRQGALRCVSKSLNPLPRCLRK